MLKTNTIWVAVVALALAGTSACKKKDAPVTTAPPGGDATAANQAASDPALTPEPPAAAAATLPAPLAKYKAALDPVLATPAGVERAKAGCKAGLFDLTEAIRELPPPASVDANTWSTATNALSTASISIDEVCTGDGGGPEEATDVIDSSITSADKHLQAIVALLPK